MAKVDFIKPYLPMVAPMLEQALFDPVSEARRHMLGLALRR